eukprot:m.215336 g.215336  ORF g.215336 m.215336 type:complete len:74 (+) comp25613_c0_seq1:947-1168(+)
MQLDQWLAQLRAPGTLDSCSTHILRGTLTQRATPQTTVYTHNVTLTSVLSTALASWQIRTRAAFPLLPRTGPY